MKLRTPLKWLLRLVLVLVAVVAAVGLWLWWLVSVDYQRIPDVIYGRKFGTAWTMDVFQPAQRNGLGVVVLVSGSWKSGHDQVRPWLVAPLLQRGYTVFAVVHGSQPRFSVPEIAEQLQRAVRFIRYSARRFDIDPDRLGVVGGSSGGHLSLLLATQGGPGYRVDPDPVDRASSAVQAVACFFPVTDLLNLGKSTENAGDGGPPKSFRAAFGPRGEKLEDWKQLGRELSPIYHVSSNQPPILIIHGDADTLVPLEQSEWFVEKARAAGATVKLIVRPGKKHGWLTMWFDIGLFAEWFDEHLKSRRPALPPG